MNGCYTWQQLNSVFFSEHSEVKLTICSSFSLLCAARAACSLFLETACGRTRHRSITERHLRNSSFILRRSSSHRDNWDEHRQLGRTEKRSRSIPVKPSSNSGCENSLCDQPEEGPAVCPTLPLLLQLPLHRVPQSLSGAAERVQGHLTLLVQLLLTVLEATHALRLFWSSCFRLHLQHVERNSWWKECQQVLGRGGLNGLHVAHSTLDRTHGHL